MIKCPNCGKDNADGRINCKFCGFYLYAAPQEPDPDDLLERIKRLEAELSKRDQELQALWEELRQKTETLQILSEELRQKTETPDYKPTVEDHPEVRGLRQAVESKQKQLDDKETHLQLLVKEIEKLRRLAPVSKPEPGAQIAIDTYPVVQTPFHMLLDHATNSIDLATTDYRIRASLERTADGLQIVVHEGADINVRPSQKGFKWRRLKGGDKVPVQPGTIFFDTTRPIGARLSLQT